MRAPYLFSVFAISVLSLMPSAPAQNNSSAATMDDIVIRDRQMPNGAEVLSFPVGVPGLMNEDALYTTRGLTAVFEFRDTKGLGKKAIVNQDKSLIAVNNYPATKTTYTHLFIRYPNGDLMAINSFNQRVAKLLTGRWASAAVNKVKTISISGRIMQLSIFNYTRGNEGEELLIKVSVGQDGTLRLVRRSLVSDWSESQIYTNRSNGMGWIDD